MSRHGDGLKSIHLSCGIGSAPGLLQREQMAQHAVEPDLRQHRLGARGDAAVGVARIGQLGDDAPPEPGHIPAMARAAQHRLRDAARLGSGDQRGAGRGLVRRIGVACRSSAGGPAPCTASAKAASQPG